MIGNDIIDLPQSRQESNWQRAGWIAKLFSVKEQEYLSRSSDKEMAVWLLWSMKEAAYKIVNRSQRKTFFAPAKFDGDVRNLSEDAADGSVSFQEVSYRTQSIICKDFIHTIAYAPLSENEYPHLIIRPIAAGMQLQKQFSFHKDGEGIPFIFNNISKEAKAASFSHHGRYQALVF